MPRVGKFLVLFSRPGQRVIVDYRGDVVVRPSPHEIHIRNGARSLFAPKTIFLIPRTPRGLQRRKLNLKEELLIYLLFKDAYTGTIVHMRSYTVGNNSIVAYC